MNISLIEPEADYVFVVTARDIRVRKQTEEALIQAKSAADAANQAKSSFLSTMSHELRTPLNAIIDYSDLLLEDKTASTNPQVVSDVSKIKSAGAHL